MVITNNKETTNYNQSRENYVIVLCLRIKEPFGLRNAKFEFGKIKKKFKCGHTKKPEDHWSCIAHLIAEDVLKSAVIEEKKFKNIECKWFGPRSMTDLDLWYS